MRFLLSTPSVPTKLVQIAQSFNNVKVTQHVFENYAIQRNFALGLAKGMDLFLDADERLTRYKNEINETVKNKEIYGLLFQSYFMFCDKRLHY
jgi:hypothetical protein